MPFPVSFVSHLLPRLLGRGLLACTLAALPVLAAAEPVWFVVAERTPEHGDSFLLPLTDSDDIAAARARIAQGDASGVGSIASVRIAAGGDGFNRDVLREGAPLWSWHVTEFLGFYDVAIELCDGWPTFIEQDVEGFIANTQGVACLWGYQVVAELDAPPAFAVGEGLDGAWYDPATPGQGLFVEVLEAQSHLALGWYGFDPAAPGTQRWWTAEGGFAGDSADLTLYRTTGGRFAAPDPVQSQPVGEASVVFADCNHATLHYAFEGGPQGSIALQRVVPMAGCRRR